MTIISLLNQIRSGEIVLPAIQRDFVWPEEKIFTLLDSIMRGYPVGIVLLWETYEDIRYRPFVLDFKSENLPAFHDNSQKRRLKLVLDGQQRLQSLYIALYGTHQAKSLYFDVLSGRDSEDLAEERYIFDFLTTDEFQRRQANLTNPPVGTLSKGQRAGAPECFIKVSELFAMGSKEKQALKRDLAARLSLSDDDEARLDLNLAQLDDGLSKDPNVLKVSTVDENLPSTSPSRKSEADVLEIFVRVNREGTPLSRSDLIFSMLKLNWRESAEDLPEFIKKVNEGNSFELDTDFAIRCLFAASELGTKFDIDLLRNKRNVDKIKASFERCCDSIKSTLDFVVNSCWCASDDLIGGHNTLVPFVYYLFHRNNHQVPNDQLVNARKAFCLFAFAKPFSRYGDSRLWKFIKEELKPLADRTDGSFPLSRAVWWVNYWEDIDNFGEKLLQKNPILALHLVQDLTGLKTQYARNAGEMDHIFPRAVLRKKGFDEAQINHFANFWILAKGKNQNKSDRHPDQYFKDVDDDELKRALIDRNLLDYRRFTTFLNWRSGEIIKKLQGKLQFAEADFRGVQLAEKLKAMGVTQEQLVALLNEESKKQ